MEIFVFRHGIAIDRADPDCPPDPERFLTEKGRSRTRAAAEGIAAIAPKPEIVVTSPYVRARQTAQLAMEALDVPQSRLRVSEALLPGADPDEICEYLGQLEVDSVMLCGHAPNLDEVVAHLVGADGEAVTSLKKAGFAWLGGVAEEGGATLVALVPPRVLRSLGRAGG